MKTAWKKFKELLPALSSHHLSYKTHGHVYKSCVQNATLNASETWTLSKPDLQRLQPNDHFFSNVKPEDVATISSNELLAQFEIDDLDVILREKRLCWFRQHDAQSSVAIKTVCDMQIEVKHGPKRPKMT